MMQPTDPRQLNRLGAFGRSGLNRVLKKSVFPESIMGSIEMIIIEIRRKNPAKMTFVRHDHVIKTISAFRSN
jgi:hypothetical protein